MKREAQSFHAGFSISPLPTRVHPAEQEKVSHPSSSGGKAQLTDFSQISPNPSHTLPVHDVIHISGHILSLGFLF